MNPAIAGILATGLLASAAQAGVTYAFELRTANQTYSAAISLGSTGGSSRSVTSADVTTVIQNETSNFSGAATGSFVWDETLQRLSIDYAVQGTTFSMVLNSAVFSGGTDSGGLPAGNLVDWSNAGSGAPSFTVPDGTFTVPYSSIRFFRRTFGDGAPVPGVAWAGVLVGGVLAARRRRR